jgi:hypothetical protein
MIKRRPAAPRSIRAYNGALEISTKQFEIDHSAQPFQASPLPESCFSRSSTSKNPGCPAIADPPASPTQKPAIRTQIQPVFGGFHLPLRSILDSWNIQDLGQEGLRRSSAKAHFGAAAAA